MKTVTNTLFTYIFDKYIFIFKTKFLLDKYTSKVQPTDVVISLSIWIIGITDGLPWAHWKWEVTFGQPL